MANNPTMEFEKADELPGVERVRRSFGGGVMHRCRRSGSAISTISEDGQVERRSFFVARVVLILGLFVLSGFAVAGAVHNDRAATKAHRSFEVARLSEEGFDALTVMEEAADDVIVEADAESLGAYSNASGDVDSAIRALDQTGAFSGRTLDADRLLALHADYRKAVAEMFDGFAGGSIGEADVFEAANVDPRFDLLSDALGQMMKDSDDVARAALASMDRSQQILAVITPVVFGASLGLVTIFVVKLGRNRREMVRQSEESRYQSLHDGLTGLPNRSLLHRSSVIAVARAANTGTQMGLMMVDLDRFKDINDTLGHQTGDLVLEEVARRLRGAVRSMDTVARLGGDEFAILLPHVADVAAALQVASNVQSALVGKINAGNVALDVEASIGVALSGEHGGDVETLLQHADVAMYRAKTLDHGVCVYEPDRDDNSLERLGLLGDLRRAIDHGELVLHFQPKIELKTGGFCGAEALLRWPHPTRGMVLPGSFLPAAECSSIIRPLTRYVIDAALAECRRWRDEGNDLRLAVNISARNLLDTEFPDHVAELFDKWELPPRSLMFEVTESAIIVELQAAEAMLDRLTGLGVELAIDDFGSGYTSLAHLRTLPVQELKIDQSLVAQLAVSARDAVIVRAVIDLAKNLGLRTVAEGVEDAATLDRLTSMGCDIGQGFHIAHPMTGTQLMQWCKEREPSVVLQRGA